jgi:N-ethylmaleimide reductase
MLDRAHVSLRFDGAVLAAMDYLHASNEYQPMPTLHDPLRLGALDVPNRIFMAPLTRCRAEPGDVPGALIATYYAQRASAGLLIAEATMVAAGNAAFPGAPGVHSAAQVAGWKLVTDAVHSAGGRIFLQIWHGGRACHPALNAGAIPVAPSAIAIEGETYTLEGMKPHVTPRELRDDEIPSVVEAFRLAARHAKAAGFDGVEVHGANGYLLDEFLRDGSNRRSGPYGGPIAHRARLLLEVVDAVIAELGAGRVGVRISPLNSYNSMQDSDPVALASFVAAELDRRGIAYLHLMRSDFLGKQSGDVVTPVRKAFRGNLVLNMGFTPAEAAETVSNGTADAIAFGTAFLANPDLPARICAGALLNTPDPSTFYSPGAKGYTDYPTMG